jgi:uncharacterized membrane protein (UPF0136 family)
MGYIRTGSVPSIAAGMTVGLLCMYYEQQDGDATDKKC